MEGGRLLGDGVYGCVFEPSLVCKPGTKKQLRNSTGNTIGKITDNNDAELEMNASLVLDTVPNGRDYFIYVDSYCSPESRDKQEDQDISKCHVTKGKKLSNFIIITMPYGGQTLEQISAIFIQMRYIEIGKNLLEAGTWLLLKNLVHFDLHANNVVITDKPRIIDFGVVWSPLNLNNRTISNLFREYNPLISHESPETSYMNGVLKGYGANELIEDILNRKRHFNLRNILGRSKQYTGEEFRNFIKNSISIRNNDSVQFYKLFWTKFDAWAFGILLYNLLNKFILDSSFVENIYSPNKKKINACIGGLLQTDPLKRIDAIEALECWSPDSALLRNPDVVVWLKSRKIKREQLRAFS